MSIYDNIPKSSLKKIIRYPFTNFDLFYNYHNRQPYDKLRKEDIQIIKEILCNKNFQYLMLLSKQALFYLKTIIKFKKINNYISYILSIYMKNEMIPYINNLVGACRFVEIKYKNKHFYLIGEHHTDDTSCNYKNGDILIPDLIELMVRTTPKVIDLFIERQIETKKIKTVKNFLRATHDKFEKCIRKLCIHKNMRIHNVDIRSKKIDSTVDLIYRYAKASLKNKDVYDLEKEIKKNKNEITKLLGNQKLIKEAIDDTIEFHDKISKQLDNINDQKIKSELRKFILKIQNELPYKKVTYKDLLSNNKVIYEYLKRFLSSYRISYMDLYCLARIFRSFKQIKDKPSNDPQNIIIHAGDHHIRNYMNFLIDIGGKVIYEKENKNRYKYNCINIKDVKQPFFK